MRKTLLAVVFVLQFLPPALSQEKTVTQADLLYRLIDLERLTQPPPAGEQTRMFSSYDRASRVSETGELIQWDANADWGKFIRAEHGWSVMAELDGPGAITRVWSANPHGMLRIVLDGQIAVEAPFENLFDGQLAPFAEPLCYANPNNGGKNCYFPLGFNRRCEILVRDSQSYYQINMVNFPPGTQVVPFQSKLDEAAQEMLARVGELWSTGLSPHELFGERRLTPIAVEQDVRPGAILEQTIDGPGTIRALYIALTDPSTPPAPYTLHKIILRVFWDGADRPAIEAPLVDFFGSGFNLRPFNSLVAGTDMQLDIPLPDRRPGEDRYMYCYFPMPFAGGARLELENRGRRKLGLMLYMRVDPTEPPADSLRFHARYRKEDPCQVLDYPLLETNGAGRVVGCVLNVDCPRRAWWGEGDDKVWIDGERFPSYFGTGSEDYLGDAWGLRPHIRPYQGVTLTNPYGKNSAYRWHIADCINFQRSLRFTIENWQFGGYQDTYYSTVAFWYGQPGADDFFKPITVADTTPPGLRIPNSFEIEDHVRGEGWGHVIAEKQTRASELSGTRAVSISASTPVEVTIPSDESRVVRLKVRINPRRPFERVTVQDAAGKTVGVADYARDSSGFYDLGLLRLNVGENVVRVTCAKPAMLDCWILDPVPTVRDGWEAETLTVVDGSGVENQIEDARLDWSGGSQLLLDFGAVGKKAVLALPPVAKERVAGVTLRVTKGPSAGRFQTYLDDQPLGEPIDLYQAEETLAQIPLGAVHLSAGPHSVAFEALQPYDAAQGRTLGLDALELVWVKSEYAVECEDLPITAFEGTDHERQALRGQFSGGAQIWSRATAPGAWLELDVPVRSAGKYKLSIVYTTSYDYAIMQTWVNGEKAGEPFNTFGQLAPGPVRELGTYDLPAGPLKLRCEVVGKAAESPGYYFGVDCMLLEPVQ